MTRTSMSWGSLRAVALLGLIAGCSSEDPLGPSTGRIQINVSMAGLDPDPDGLVASVDGTTPVPVPSNGVKVVTAGTGYRTLTLTGLADNCVSLDGLTRHLRVQPGELADVEFQFSCSAATGVVEVSVVTQGTDPDLNGYLVTVDSTVPQLVSAMAGMTRFAPIGAGPHQITFHDLAPNCAVVGGNPLPAIQVQTGGATRDTVRVGATVLCAPRYGTLRLITSTVGPADPDGYFITVDSLPNVFRLAGSDTLSLYNLSVGTHQLGITDVAGNCSVSGTATPSVAVVGGQVTIARFDVSCLAPAILRVTAPTSGANPDPGYLVRVDGGPGRALIANDTLSLSLVPGAHDIWLDNVATNCTVGVSNPATVSVSAATATDLSMPVSCASAPRTGLDLTVTTTGAPPGAYYHLFVCTEFDIFDCWGGVDYYVPPDTVMQLDLAPGDYLVYLVLPSNCQYTPTVGLTTITPGSVTSLRFDVACVPAVDFSVTVTTTGVDKQDRFSLSVDAGPSVALPADAPLRLSSFQGDHSFSLVFLNPNCRVTSDNPVYATLLSGAVTPIAFAVDCQAYPRINVSVSTTGANLPASFVVGLTPGIPDDIIPQNWSITPGGTLTVGLIFPGDYRVQLDQVPSNCTVSGPNPVAVQAVVGGVSDVTFAVTCQ